MDIISLAKRSQDGVSTLDVTLEDDEANIRTFKVPETSSRYARVTELATRALTLPEGDEREKAFDGLAAILDGLSRRIQAALELVPSDTEGTFALSRAGVLYEGELLPATISNHILRILREEETNTGDSFTSWTAFAKFVEKLHNNVNPYVRDQLFGWLASLEEVSSGFSLSSNGNLIAYKGVGDKDGVPTSVFSGHALVVSRDDTGKEVITEYKNSQIPNVVGTEVVMPRAEVTDDPAVACAAGLHVSNIDYARGWARGHLLVVEVNPANFVSVPLDAGFQKARVSRYKVLSVTTEGYAGTVYEAPADLDNEGYSDDDEYDDEGYDY